LPPPPTVYRSECRSAQGTELGPVFDHATSSILADSRYLMADS
jgi:hypothetical protein